MAGLLLIGTFGALLAAGSWWAASPLLDAAPGAPDGDLAPDSVDAVRPGAAGDEAMGAGFADYFTIYP